MAEDVVTEEDLGLKPKACGILAEDELVVHASARVRVCGDLALRDIVRSSTVHVERVAITHALRKTGGNKSKAARLLQVDYKTLYSKVKEYGIQIEGEQLRDQEAQ
jgi:two-component system nitrogen regulation response regulator GlnG